MRVITILNRIEKHKSFVYGRERFEEAEDGTVLVIPVVARKNSRPICSQCGQLGATYDHQPERRFEYVPLWGFQVFLTYCMRRVACRTCGVKVERVPWCDGKHAMTITYRWYLAGWAKRLSWQEISVIFRTSWDSVYRAVEFAVQWGLAHRDLSQVTAVGIDEVAYRKGHKYLTLIYDISHQAKRLLSVQEDRDEASLRQGLQNLGEDFCQRVQFVCSDMWKPYLNVIQEQLNSAVHVLDRFHIMQKFGKALDEVRAAEHRQLTQDGYEPILKHSRWCLLKRPENLTDRQTVKLSELLKYNLRTVKAYLLREDFQRLWAYQTPGWADRFLKEWTQRAMRSRIDPLKKLAATIRRHQPLILNYFRAKAEISAGAVEGLNNKVKLVTRKSYGFQTPEVAKIALLHNLGRLPEPESAHRFC